MSEKFNKSDYSNSEDPGAKLLANFSDNVNSQADCICHRCIEENEIKSTSIPFLPLNCTMMIVCPICGNKRCPHASDHRSECTKSNDPGQVGSIYG